MQKKLNLRTILSRRIGRGTLTYKNKDSSSFITDNSNTQRYINMKFASFLLLFASFLLFHRYYAQKPVQITWKNFCMERELRWQFPCHPSLAGTTTKSVQRLYVNEP